MRIAVVSDIHYNMDAFQTVIASLPAYDELLCLGDVVGYGPQPNEVVEQLQQLHPNAVLMGNHDYAVVTGDTSGFSEHAAEAVKWTRGHITRKNQDFLSKLKFSFNLELGGAKVGLFHGSPSDPLTEYVYPGIPKELARKLILKSKASVVLLGHTHVPMVYPFEREMLANPGSVGQPRDGDPRASFAVLSVSDVRFSFEITRVEYDVDSVADKIIRAGLPRFLAERLYIGM